MRKGKRFIENENLIIYVGTAIFIILAIAVGIVMYMTTKTNNEDSAEKIANENQNEVIEDVNSSIGKTVEEQEEIVAKRENTVKTTESITSKENTIKTDNTNSKTEATSKNETNNTVKTNESELSQTNSSKNTESTTSKTTDENIDKKESETKKENSEAQNKEDTSKKDENITEEKKEITFVKPTDGEIISEFAQDNLIYSETLKEWITHPGIDIKADKTSIIKASADGVISSILNDPRYGLTVVISHDDGYETVYSNLLTAEFVVEGEEVKQGQTIGTAGNTASFESSMESHLHFEILQDGKYLDPTIYLK